MGVVYEAYDPSLKRTVAIKVLPSHLTAYPDVVTRFRKEAHSAANLAHPNIVVIHNIGQEGEIYFFVMEFLKGESLEELLREDGTLPQPLSLEIIRQVALALDYAHRHGIIHRDIKPSNIMFDRENSLVKVTDFGIAKAMEAESGLTASEISVGTPRYMAPEQIKGEKAGPPSDIFSLGSVLWQLLAGRAPFEGESILTVMQKIVKEDPLKAPDFPDSVSQDVRSVIRKAMAKSPDERYRTAREMAEDIERVQKGKSVEKPRRKRIFPPRYTWVLLASAVIAGTGIAVMPIRDSMDGVGQQIILPGAQRLITKPSNEIPAEVVAPIKTEQPEDKSALDYHVWFNRGLEEMVAQNWSGALLAFKTAEKYDSTTEVREKVMESDCERWRRMGQEASGKGNLEEALSCYKKAHELMPARQDISIEKDTIAARIDNKRKNAERFRLWFTRGKKSLEEGNSREACTALERALIYQPEHQEARSLLIQARQELAATKEAKPAPTTKKNIKKEPKAHRPVSVF